MATQKEIINNAQLKLATLRTLCMMVRQFSQNNSFSRAYNSLDEAATLYYEIINYRDSPKEDVTRKTRGALRLFAAEALEAYELSEEELEKNRTR